MGRNAITVMILLTQNHRPLRLHGLINIEYAVLIGNKSSFLINPASVWVKMTATFSLDSNTGERYLSECKRRALYSEAPLDIMNDYIDKNCGHSQQPPMHQKFFGTRSHTLHSKHFRSYISTEKSPFPSCSECLRLHFSPICTASSLVYLLIRYVIY
ncbi:hypothetical protein TNCV_677841 [Trichonephila clavipes]|nr:hypothetical protein TNCV_677841 [Trichonephila clavipes]